MRRGLTIALLCLLALPAYGQQVVPLNVAVHPTAPAAFDCSSPTSASLIMWHRADSNTYTNSGCSTAATSSGDNVCCWGDKGAGGRNFTQTAANCPKLQTGVVNGHSILRFDDAADQWMTGPDLSSFTNGAEVFVVIKIDNDPPATAAQTGLFGFQTTSNDTHYPWTDGVIYITFANTSRHTTTNPTPSLASWRLFDCWSETSDFACRIDAAAFFSTATNTTTSPGTTTYLGRTFSNGAQNIDGDVAEMCMYDSKLSTGDRSSLESYFDTRYNLAY